MAVMRPAVQQLAPWPEDASGAMKATAELSKAIGGDGAQTDPVARRLGPVAAEIVQNFAPDAPSSVKNEGTIRLCGYLAASELHGYGTLQSDTVGQLASTYRYSSDAFRRCGAMALLSPYRPRGGCVF